jgi:hypothetical protein
MIVACPSCQQRYRHDFVVAAVPPTARCSACDERFPLDRKKHSYRLVQPDLHSPLRDVMPPVPPAPTTPEAQPSDPAFDLGLEVPAGSPVAIDTVVDPDAVQAEVETRSRRVSSLRSLGESLVALVPCGVGAVLAYHFSGPLGQDPITWAALGGAVGLLLGWACLLWITRGD